MGNAQILKGAALVDAKEHLVAVDGIGQAVEAVHFGAATNQPAVGALHALFAIGIGRGVFHALVKRHGNGGGEVGLDLHALLGPHENLFAVHVGGKIDPLLLDAAQFCQREDLKAAAIGQNGAVPVHKLVQSPHLADQPVAGADMEMVGVGKLHLTADLAQEHGVDAALDGGAGAHVHEHRGLNIPVNGMQNSPARAAVGGQ